MRKSSKEDLRARWAGVALITGPVLFVAAMGVEQAFRPGFSDLSNTISDLGVDTNGWSYAWIFASSIIVLGLLTLGAAYSLSRVLGRPGRNGVLLLGLAGLGYTGVGVFNQDSNFLVHSVFALAQFVTSGLTVLVLAPAFAMDSRWGPSYASFSRLCGIIELVSLGLFVAGVGGPAYIGLVERFIVAPALLWAVIAGLHLSHLPDAIASN